MKKKRQKWTNPKNTERTEKRGKYYIQKKKQKTAQVRNKQKEATTAR